jgi:hypothetical protein
MAARQAFTKRLRAKRKPHELERFLCHESLSCLCELTPQEAASRLVSALQDEDSALSKRLLAEMARRYFQNYFPLLVKSIPTDGARP